MRSSRDNGVGGQLPDDEDHLGAFQFPGSEGDLSERARRTGLFDASGKAALGPLHKMPIPTEGLEGPAASRPTDRVRPRHRPTARRASDDGAILSRVRSQRT